MKLSPILIKEMKEKEERLKKLDKLRKKIESNIEEVVSDLGIIYRVINELIKNENDQAPK